MNEKKKDTTNFDTPLYIEYLHYIFSLGKYKYYNFSDKKTLYWLVTISRILVYMLCILSFLSNKYIAGVILFFESLFLLSTNMFTFTNLYVIEIILYKDRQRLELMEDYMHEINH